MMLTGTERHDKPVLGPYAARRPLLDLGSERGPCRIVVGETPKFLPSCAHTANPSATTDIIPQSNSIIAHIPSMTEKLKSGYIYAGKESMNTPARACLRLDPRVNLPSTTTYATGKTRTSVVSKLSTLTEAQTEEKKTRPCLYLRVQAPQADNLGGLGGTVPQVSLLGTFDGTARDHLAKVFRVFLAPVHPNPSALPQEFVLRTTPPWRTKKWPAWIYCASFSPTDMNMSELWGGSTNGLGFHLDKQMLESFRVEAENRLKLWQQLLMTEGVLEHLVDEYMSYLRDFINDELPKGPKASSWIRDNAHSSKTTPDREGCKPIPSTVSGTGNKNHSRSTSYSAATPSSSKTGQSAVHTHRKTQSSVTQSSAAKAAANDASDQRWKRVESKKTRRLRVHKAAEDMIKEIRHAGA
ncbi:hypothetical protein FA95DRAFT_1567247 [Auriscalpium vulgare]|uniref:Uncharacterized protein n=1 Tax=Auriscalpium vulgare TaxID=40419 RepID=A0ACB8R6X4_9AGAM|nr:hypothetical protein FA95DRAFT_1567247 [Auriscalpium vulgare]